MSDFEILKMQMDALRAQMAAIEETVKRIEANTPRFVPGLPWPPIYPMPPYYPPQISPPYIVTCVAKSTKGYV